MDTDGHGWTRIVAVRLAEFFSKRCSTTVNHAVVLQRLSILPSFSDGLYSCPFVSIRGPDRLFHEVSETLIYRVVPSSLTSISSLISPPRTSFVVEPKNARMATATTDQSPSASVNQPFPPAHGARRQPSGRGTHCGIVYRIARQLSEALKPLRYHPISRRRTNLQLAILIH